jgi:glycosyltransferase involved in cell wall biosynthesis
MQFVTGYVAGATQLPVLENYDVIIVQEPRGRWFDVIRDLRSHGKVVLAEYDDYVHGIRKSTDHDFKEFFQPRHLREMELCMRACDGLIASTDYIALRYKRYVPRVYVCENGLDMGRYRLSRPPRGVIDGKETVTIMWSGATGHRRGTEPWLEVVERIMREHPEVCLATIGQDFASRFGPEFGDRVISIPFAALETYPAAMMLGDIALAPAGKSSWYRGKSDLRAMEAAALGIPVVADEHYERSVVDGQSGFVVYHAGQVYGALKRLIEDHELRRSMGEYAREHAKQFDMAVRREQWREAVLDAYMAKYPEENFLAA